MKKLLTFLLAALSLAGCSSAKDSTEYELTCMTAVARFQIMVTSDKIENFDNIMPTYTITMPDGGKLTMEKGACVIYLAAKPAAEESNEVDAAPSASPSPSQ